MDDATSLKWSQLTHSPVRLGSGLGAGLCYHEWQRRCQSQTCQLGWHQCHDSWFGTRSVRHCHKCVVCVCLWWCVMLFKQRLAAAPGWWYGRLGKQEIAGPSGLILPALLLSWLRTTSCCEDGMAASEARWRAWGVCVCVAGGGGGSKCEGRNECWSNCGCEQIPITAFRRNYGVYIFMHVTWRGLEKTLKNEYSMNGKNNAFIVFCSFFTSSDGLNSPASVLVTVWMEQQMEVEKMRSQLRSWPLGLWAACLSALW